MSLATAPVPASDRLLHQLRAHDDATYRHSIAVGRYAEMLARTLGLPDDLVLRAGEVGRLHDCGKCAVPHSILNAHHVLTDDDQAVMRRHVDVGHRLVLEDPATATFAAAVRAHHERIDGLGYPDGLRGDAIPIEARIVAVVDTFDALYRGRPYREAMSESRVLTILHCGRAMQWQSEFVDSFIGVIERFGALSVRP
jgi:putative nucleotidyltransferase with HDIG domain